MMGRAVGFTVTASSQEVAKKNRDRCGVVFSCANSVGTGSVILKDNDDATAANGIPLSEGQTLELHGTIAGHRWSAIRLVATDTVLGVVELFAGEGVADSDAVPIGIGETSDVCGAE